MKPLARTNLGAGIAVALAAAVISCLFWIAATTQGTRWLLTSVIPLSGIGFSVQKIEGSISSRLQLSEVRLGLTHQKIGIGRLELLWNPFLLLSGTFAIQELSLDRVRIQDDTPLGSKPPTLDWPRASDNSQLFDGMISRLLVTDFSYHRLREQPVLVTTIAGSVSWQDSTLSFTDFRADTPSGRINGSLSACFRQPLLTADLAVALARPTWEIDQFSLKIRQSDAKDHEQLAGKISLAAGSRKRKLLELGGDIGMTGKSFNLRRLHLTRPGQKGVITGDGSLEFTALESILSLQINTSGLDLQPELKLPTNLSGTLRFTGTLDNYRGNFTLANQARGWQSAAVSAAYQGTSRGLKLDQLTGRLLDGSLAGNLYMNWHNGIGIQGALNGRNLNPARIDPSWKGLANFNATGRLKWSDQTPLTGNISGVLLESSLHGQTLTGGGRADFADGNISLARLDLQGKGFYLHAAGELNQRLTLAVQISDFSRLVPGAAGKFQSEGWLRRRNQLLSGAFSGRGSKLTYAGTEIAQVNLTARLDQGPDYPLHFTAALQDLIHDGYQLKGVTVTADGTAALHRLNATLRAGSSEARLGLNGGYDAGAWQGELIRLAGNDRCGPWKMSAPATFYVSSKKLSLSPMLIRAGTAERLEVAVDLAMNPLNGLLLAKWDDLNLARANCYLKDMQITGSSHGSVSLGFLPGKKLTLAGNATGSGTITGQGSSITLRQSDINFDGGQQGLKIGVNLGTIDGGSLKGTFLSPAPLQSALPEKGALTAELNEIDLALFKPWLPSGTALDGRISGRTKGNLLPGQRFELDGNASISGGALHRQRPDGELKLSFKSATTSWGWREDSLSGALSIATAQYGKIQGNYQLPLAARFPLAVAPKGPLRAELNAQVQEKGFITTLFPGLIQESFGELDVELAVSGTWAAPQFGGKIRLAKAGAYLPAAGIHLKNLQLAAHLEKNLVRIDSFRAVSGPGHIEGTALITLADWRVIGYRGVISGNNFQTVYFPELQILSTPKFSFEGTPDKLKLRGELRLPELRIAGAHSGKVIAPSSDVIQEGKAVPAAKSSPLALDIQVRVLLGEQAFVKLAGIDAQLGGAVDLSFTTLDRITSTGEINVLKGRYRTYGVNLEIVRGRLFFAGGAIDRPSLDFLALRTIGDVRAGVTVAGNLRKPLTKLYSEPPMPDVDVLAYIVLGHPLGSSGEQAGLLAQAAGALLTSGQGAVLQEQIKNQLGLSTLEIQGGVGGASRPMGYKPLQPTSAGAAPASPQSGLTETVLTVGKYLTPELYVSYGKSLFTGNNLFRLRYDIFKQWQIETQTGGGQSGADLYYKMEFK